MQLSERPLFVAIPITGEIAWYCENIQHQLRLRIGDALRMSVWPLHCTLVHMPLGQDIATTIRTVEEVAITMPGLPEVAIAPSLSFWTTHSRVVIALAIVSHENQVAAMALCLQAALQHAGLQVDSIEPWRPHITLGYCSEQELSVIGQSMAIPACTMPVDRITVYGAADPVTIPLLPAGG